MGEGAQKWRYVKLGSEGIAIKPDTGDLKTDMQTIAMCGLDESRARLMTAAPELLEALKAAREEIRLIRMKDANVVYNPCLQSEMAAAISKAEGQ